MQKKKSFFKGILSIVIAFVFAVSPMFLTGCIDFSKIYSGTPFGVDTQNNNNSGNSGGSGGGSSGSGNSNGSNSGGTQNEQSDEEFDENSILAVPNQYIDTMLVTYRPNITADAVENVFEQVSIYAICELYRQFGYSVESVGNELSLKSYNAKTENNSTSYVSNNILLKSLFGDSIVVSDAEKIFEFTDDFKFAFEEYDNGSDWQEDLEYALEPVSTTDEQGEERSTEEINDETNYKQDLLKQIHKNVLNAYVNNLKIRRKFALGLVLISANKNLGEFNSKAGSIVGSTDSNILTNSRNVFSTYISDINSFQLSATQITQLSTFVGEYVLGTNVVDNAFVSSLSNNIANLLTKVTGYANYGNDHTFVGGNDEGMNGHQNYQSIVIMPKKIVDIAEMDLFFSTENQNGVRLHLYLRYYDATNGWATFNNSIASGVPTTLYDLGSVNIAYFSYDEDDEETGDYDFDFDDGDSEGDEYDGGPTIYSGLHNDQGIMLQDILSSANFDGKLPAFEQIADFEKNSPGVAVGEFGNGVYFETLTIGDRQIMVFSQNSIESKQSYVELLFVTENVDDTFQFSVNIEDEDFS